MSKNSISLILLSMLSLAACTDTQEKVTETAKAQSEISAIKQVEAENNNLRERAQEMEQDLNSRHRFFQALKGRFEGSFTTTMGTLNLRVTLIPSLSPYHNANQRPVRRLEEIAYDLNSLTFTAQIVQWNPHNSLSMVSCRVEGIKPDLRQGEIIVSGVGCDKNVFFFKVASDELDSYHDSNTSEILTRRLLDGAEDKVSILVGELQTGTPDIYTFKVKR